MSTQVGTVVEHEGKHYLLITLGGITRALPVVRNDEGQWVHDPTALGGVRGTQHPNAEGGMDCTIEVPTLAVSGEVLPPE